MYSRLKLLSGALVLMLLLFVAVYVIIIERELWDGTRYVLRSTSRRNYEHKTKQCNIDLQQARTNRTKQCNIDLQQAERLRIEAINNVLYVLCSSESGCDRDALNSLSQAGGFICKYGEYRDIRKGGMNNGYAACRRSD